MWEESNLEQTWKSTELTLLLKRKLRYFACRHFAWLSYILKKVMMLYWCTRKDGPLMFCTKLEYELLSLWWELTQLTSGALSWLIQTGRVIMFKRKSYIFMLLSKTVLNFHLEWLQQTSDVLLEADYFFCQSLFVKPETDALCLQCNVICKRFGSCLTNVPSLQQYFLQYVINSFVL